MNDMDCIRFGLTDPGLRRVARRGRDLRKSGVISQSQKPRLFCSMVNNRHLDKCQPTHHHTLPGSPAEAACRTTMPGRSTGPAPKNHRRRQSSLEAGGAGEQESNLGDCATTSFSFGVPGSCPQPQRLIPSFPVSRWHNTQWASIVAESSSLSA